MTEDEAKTKWCHAATASHTDPFTGFRATDTPKTMKVHACIGSACMAWRWDREGWALDFDGGGPFKLRKSAEAHGYCGKAGKP